MKFLAVASLVAALATSAAAEPIAIVGARVHVRPGEVVDNATVIIDGGRIRAVGAGLAIPTGARVIDGKGKQVTAGFIEAVSGVGLVGVDLEASSVDGAMPATDALHADAIHAAYQARDGFAPTSVTIPVARTGGVTTVIAAPGGGLVAGQSAAFTLDGAVDPVLAPAAMHAEIGPDGAGAVNGSRGNAIAALRELLDDAASYNRDRAAYERNQKRRMLADRLDLAALAPVLAGTEPLVVTAHAEGDIRAAVRLAQAARVKLVIAGGDEAWRVAPLLAKTKVPVILDPTRNLPTHLDATDVRDDAPAILAKAGVPVAISTLGGASTARTVRQLAGVAVGNGLPWAQALAALTTVPASIYHLDGRGLVAAGAIADVVVWSGDPLELDSAAEVVIIGGAVQSSTSHQTRLLDRYRHLPARAR